MNLSLFDTLGSFKRLIKHGKVAIRFKEGEAREELKR